MEIKNRRCNVAYYSICPDCGASLDPGEKCSCREEAEEKQDYFAKHLKMEPEAGQLAFVFEGRSDCERKSYC